MPFQPNSPAARDVAYVLHPYTNFAAFDREGSTVYAAGRDHVIIDSDGREYLDGIAGLWCVNIGHGRRDMAEHLAEQAARLARPGLTGVGCGFARYAALSDCSGSLDDVLPDLWPRAAVMTALARDWLGSNQALPAFQAQPVYLRDKVAKKQGAA